MEKKTSKTCKRALLKTFDIQGCSNKNMVKVIRKIITMQRTFLPKVYKSLFAVLLLAFCVSLASQKSQNFARRPVCMFCLDFFVLRKTFD